MMRSRMEEQSDNRARMLAQIRNALGRPAAPVAPEPLPPFDSHIPTEDDAGLVEIFSRELEKVGGRVIRAQSTEELCELLKELSSPEEYASVAVSACEVLDRSGIREWLISKGRQVVPSLEEFTIAESEATQARSGQDVSEPLKKDSVDEYKHVLMEADLGVTSADYALADTGTLVLVSGGEQHRLISLLPPVHVCLLDPRHIFASLTDLLAHRHKVDQCQDSLPPHAMTCITGPSRTADIELTITMGIHGPRTLQVVLYSSTENKK
jgi:L-lactate dehydrogenase complex protein LldG